MQFDFFNHNRTPSYASMSTISGHGCQCNPYTNRPVPCQICLSTTGTVRHYVWSYHYLDHMHAVYSPRSKFDKAGCKVCHPQRGVPKSTGQRVYSKGAGEEARPHQAEGHLLPTCFGLETKVLKRIYGVAHSKQCLMSSLSLPFCDIHFENSFLLNTTLLSYLKVAPT